MGLIAILPFSYDRLSAIPNSLVRVAALLERLGIKVSNLADFINLAASAKDLFDAHPQVARREFAGQFVIPANEIKTFRGTLTIQQDISLISIYPHMHLLGKSCEVYAVDPQGERTNLLRVLDWDFNWQGSYTFTHFQKITAGSKIHAFVTYDNTADNPLNPSIPPREMSWGEKTTDEMLMVAMQYVPYQPGDENIALAPNASDLDPAVAAGSSIQGPLPARAVLHPPYPNPFNSLAHIRFAVPGRTVVRLEVFDILGTAGGRRSQRSAGRRKSHRDIRRSRLSQWGLCCALGDSGRGIGAAGRVGALRACFSQQKNSLHR